MGLIQDQDGIYRRYLEERDNWTEHLENTKKFIVSSLEAGVYSSISLFGTGWMLDVPIKYLLEHFQRVICYDIRHPATILRQYGKHPGIEFTEMDLTGLLEKIYRRYERRLKPSASELMEMIRETEIRLPEKTDYYVSANVLNQLDILLIDYLKKKVRLEGEQIGALRRSLQEQHLSLLPGGRSCLVTDYEEHHLDSLERVIAREPLLYCTLPEDRPSAEWTWKFDRRQSYDPKWNINFMVKGIRL